MKNKFVLALVFMLAVFSCPCALYSVMSCVSKHRNNSLSISCNIKGKQYIDYYTNEVYNEITWKAPVEIEPKKYLIYRDLYLKNLIRTVPAKQKHLLFEEHNIKTYKPYKYFIVAVTKTARYLIGSVIIDPID